MRAFLGRASRPEVAYAGRLGSLPSTSYWIGGLVIDAERQGQRHGRVAIRALLERFRQAGAAEAALSYQAENERARALYASLGFGETRERADGEAVVRLALRA